MENFITPLADIVSEKTGLEILPEHVHISSRRSFYIPETDPGRPLLLHHYRGPFFIEINYDDWEKLITGAISPLEYVNTSHWYYGYYWGGGSSINGGYFTPLEDKEGINDKEKVFNFMNILACRGSYLTTGYEPSEDDCSCCEVTECPYSKVSFMPYPLRVNTLPDNRWYFFKALHHYIRKTFDYEIRGMSCSETVLPNEIVLYRNYCERSFEVYVSDRTIKDLLYTKYAEDFNWDVFVKTFNLYVGKRLTNKKIFIEDPIDFEEALTMLKILDDWAAEEKAKFEFEQRKLNPVDPSTENDDIDPSPVSSFIDWINHFFKK